jgi:hypothetical protein
MRRSLVDVPGAASDQLVSYAVERLQIDLFGCSSLREAHGRARHGLGVDGVVLLRLEKGLKNCAGTMRIWWPIASS